MKLSINSFNVTEFLLENKAGMIAAIDTGLLTSVFGGLSASQFTHLLCVIGFGVSMTTGLVVLAVIIAGLSYWLDKYGYEAALTECLAACGEAVNMYDDAKEYLSNLF